jgi:hypothetical protein
MPPVSVLKVLWKLSILWCLGLTLSLPLSAQQAAGANANDIRKLSQDFTQTSGDIDPWIFYPQSNIQSLSTSDHRGLLTIRDAGKGQDIKGVLKDPIPMGQYPLPWEFQLGFLQPESKAGDAQTNYAIGLNLAVTFSDPSTWPKDRTQVPTDTHSLQLFVARIGNYGEIYRTGIPQLRFGNLNYGDPSPEAYMLYGRGDLAPNVTGDWKIPYIWLGYQPPEPGQFGAAFGWSWEKYGGPAEQGGLQDIRFRVRVLSPTKLEVGFGYGYMRGWRMRTIDVSRFGKITGIWQIGPIVSLDRWMADDLAPKLNIYPTPVLDPPNPGSRTYSIDYMHFFGEGPENFEQLSDDFNVPGVPADSKFFIEDDVMAETWSHPGYLTLTSSGKSDGWALCPMVAGEMTAGLAYIELSKFKPPMEFEMAFEVPDDSIPWSFFHSLSLTDEKNNVHNWSPGMQNIPGKGRIYINESPVNAFETRQSTDINVVFKTPIPQSVLTHKPLRMLLQIIDEHHLRVGFKGEEAAPWYWSEVFDTSNLFGKIMKYQLPCLVSYILDGSGVGNYPHPQQLMIDYIHYRYGQTK